MEQEKEKQQKKFKEFQERLIKLQEEYQFLIQPELRANNQGILPVINIFIDPKSKCKSEGCAFQKRDKSAYCEVCAVRNKELEEKGIVENNKNVI